MGQKSDMARANNRLFVLLACGFSGTFSSVRRTVSLGLGARPVFLF